MITVEWLAANGFKRDQYFGWTRKLSEGPGGSELNINLGNWPSNVPCASLTVHSPSTGCIGLVTNAQGAEDILALVRLLGGAAIDHPHEA